MNESLPSRTCLYVAAGRALGARDPDPAVRNPDYLAERLLGPEECALVSDQACVHALDQDPALKNMEALSSAMMMRVRTRFIEERLAAAIEHGATQLMILGAGFDARAYRLTDLLRNLRVFEVDQPSTQEYKRRRIHETAIEVPANLTYVPVDFRRDKLKDALLAADYDSTQVTFFIWEGVTMYLPKKPSKTPSAGSPPRLPGASSYSIMFIDPSSISWPTCPPTCPWISCRSRHVLPLSEFASWNKASRGSSVSPTARKPVSWRNSDCSSPGCSPSAARNHEIFT